MTGQKSLKKIKNELGISSIELKDDIKAYMWAYRYDNGNNKYLAFDLVNIKNNFIIVLTSQLEISIHLI
jgi:hypothetical protein